MKIILGIVGLSLASIMTKIDAKDRQSKSEFFMGSRDRYAIQEELTKEVKA